MKALIIIDVQEAFVGRRRKEAAYQKVMANINAAAEQFRQSDAPVIVVRDISEGNGSGYDNVLELVVEPTDIEVLKIYNNSFWKTDLDSMLRSMNVDKVLLCGNAAEFCVTATYFGAKERGYIPYILQDGVLAETEAGLAEMETVRPMLPKEKIPSL
ncbi:MAG: isochorismatase family protein [Bacillota bacterium]